MNDVVQRTIDLGDIKLSCAEIGKGPLVLFLHGFPECWITWRHQLPALAEAGFHAVAPDQRGYGKSDKPEGLDAYRVEVLAQDVARLVEALGEKRAHVVAHDWGGAIAWFFSMWYPERLDRLTILNAPHPARFSRAVKRPRQFLRSSYMLFFQIPLLPEALIRAGDFFLFRQLFRRDPARPGAYSDEVIETILAEAREPGAVRGMLAWYRAMMQRPTHTRWKPIERPVQVIWGEKDRYLLREIAEPSPEWVPNLRFTPIAEASHWVQADAPERVNNLLIDFFRA
ncbi:MAG TPA: alpha/beta fold hydrolase [Myxococcales bacterium]|nr:alpha/beta fold hydrolase [Myxococcales bacterium]